MHACTGAHRGGRARLAYGLLRTAYCVRRTAQRSASRRQHAAASRACGTVVPRRRTHARTRTPAGSLAPDTDTANTAYLRANERASLVVLGELHPIRAMRAPAPTAGRAVGPAGAGVGTGLGAGRAGLRRWSVSQQSAVLSGDLSPSARPTLYSGQRRHQQRRSVGIGSTGSRSSRRFAFAFAFAVPVAVAAVPAPA